MPIQPVLGMPRVGSTNRANFRKVFREADWGVLLPGGKIISGAATRDPGNGSMPGQVRAGLLMGKITSGGKYGASVLGLSTGALTATGTTLSTSAAIATEIARRIGTSGTFKLTGPPTAAGTVRTLTVTFSAVSTTTGDVTITALGVNEVQTVNLTTAATAGNLRLLVQKTDGTFALTPNIAWSATDATLLSNANTALDTATGVVGGIVATAISATDTDLGFVLTYSGTGYAAQTWALAQVDTMFTSNTGANVVRTTTGVDGRFVTASLIQPTDGSESILTFLPDGFPRPVIDANGASQDQPFPDLPVAGIVDPANFVNWPSDASLKTYVRNALSTAAGGKYVFGDVF